MYHGPRFTLFVLLQPNIHHGSGWTGWYCILPTHTRNTTTFSKPVSVTSNLECDVLWRKCDVTHVRSRHTLKTRSRFYGFLTEVLHGYDLMVRSRESQKYPISLNIYHHMHSQIKYCQFFLDMFFWLFVTVTIRKRQLDSSRGTFYWNKFCEA